MRQAFLFCVLAAALAGCAAPLGGSGARPASGASGSTPVAFATKTPRLSTADVTAIKQYACALIPVRSQLGTASHRYDDAQGAIAAQLRMSAKLDMSDAISLSKQAQSELQSLTPPTQLTTYQDLLGSAASSFLVGAPSLRDDFASSNMAAAHGHAKVFLTGRHYLQRADAAWRSLARRVPLPSRSSPRCTQSYLQSLIIQTNGPPTPMPTARPAATQRHKHRPAPAPTRTPAPKRAKRVKHPSKHTPKPRPTPRPRARHRAPTAAERAYMAALGRVTSGTSSANRYLSTASALIARGRSEQVAPLLDRATLLLNAALAASNRLHAAPRSLAGAHARSALAVGDAYDAIRNFRLYLIDTAGRNPVQARKDLASARISLQLSQSSVTHASATLKKLGR